jgi:hypothetical protein
MTLNTHFTPRAGKAKSLYEIVQNLFELTGLSTIVDNHTTSVFVI